MSGESVRVRLMLARNGDDEEPVVVGAIDQVVWDHWDDEDEDAWVESCRQSWGLGTAEFRQVWAVFAPDDLLAAFATPEISAEIEA